MKLTINLLTPFLLCLLMLPGAQAQQKRTVLSAPAGSLYTQINKSGITVIPNGRLLTPVGRTIEIAPHPFGLTLSRDGTIAVTANSGVSPLSMSIITGALGPGQRAPVADRESDQEQLHDRGCGGGEYSPQG